MKKFVWAKLSKISNQWSLICTMTALDLSYVEKKQLKNYGRIYSSLFFILE